MKKLLILVTTLLIALTLSGCDTAAETNMMSSKNALSVLSYISASFLDENVESNETVSMGSINLSVNTEENSMEPQTEIEDELEQVNIYMDKLKSFMEFGASGFGSIEEEPSDRSEYTFMIRITVEENEFLLYYNIDVLSNEIDGLFILDGVEYTITAQNSLIDADEFEHDEDDTDEEDPIIDEVDPGTDEEDPITDGEGGATTTSTLNGIETMSNELDDDDDEDYEHEEDDDDDEDYIHEEENDEDYDHEENQNETEYHMTLIARNGDDVIVIEYEVEQEGSETEESFKIEKQIGGITTELEIKIEVEEDEYVLEIKENGNQYKFKMEQESQDEVTYKLEYEVDGVTGEVEITVTINELGETIYSYDISEDGDEVEIEMEDPDHDDDDEYEQEDNDEDNDL